MMLKDEIEIAKRAVNTDRVQMTLGEIANMYSASELNILPDFQRLFRWSVDRKSSFVESILIGIPIPPVFVFENADGIWDLCSMSQRLDCARSLAELCQQIEGHGYLCRMGHHRQRLRQKGKADFISNMGLMSIRSKEHADRERYAIVHLEGAWETVEEDWPSLQE